MRNFLDLLLSTVSIANTMLLSLSRARYYKILGSLKAIFIVVVASEFPRCLSREGGFVSFFCPYFLSSHKQASREEAPQKWQPVSFSLIPDSGQEADQAVFLPIVVSSPTIYSSPDTLASPFESISDRGGHR